MHCIDASSDDVVRDYETVRKEFAEYNDTLLKKPEIIVLTKTDLITIEALKEKKKLVQKFADTLLEVSVYDDTSIATLKKHLTV